MIFTLVGDLNVSASKFRFDDIFSNRMIFLTQPQSSIFGLIFCHQVKVRGVEEIYSISNYFTPRNFPVSKFRVIKALLSLSQ